MSGWRSAIALIVVLGCAGASPAYAIYGGSYGEVKIAAPRDQVRGFVIFFSDRNGLTAADDDAAQAISTAGALVAEVDTKAYVNHLNKLDEKCHRLVDDAEWFSRQVQRERGFRNYFTPIVAGVGEGATLAALVLAEASPVTIDGAVSLDPSVTITTRRPICTAASVKARTDGFRYGALTKLPGFWTVALTSALPKANRDYVTALQRDGAPLQLQEIGPDRDLGDTLRALIEPHLPRPKPLVTNISALPLIVLGVDHPSKTMAIVISGDGGWRDLDKAIAENLQHHGVPVVGWDSLRYFWSLKTPEQTANDLAAVMQTFMVKWHADKVALIGYSFGADVMPFAYNRLPAPLRSHVALIALLGFSRMTDFEITVGGWLGEPPGPKALPVLPEADKVPAPLIQCFYGQDEDDTACPELARRGVEVIRTSGGHHFDRNYGALARRILAGFKRRLVGSALAENPRKAGLRPQRSAAPKAAQL
jgi:type IV secretory pathway VirJ component